MRNFSQSSKELSGRILKRPNNICHILLHVQSGGKTYLYFIGLYILVYIYINQYLYWFMYNLFGYNSQGHTKTVVTCVVTVVVVQRTCRGETGIGRMYIYICYADSLPAETPGKAHIDNMIYLLYIITEVNSNLINFIYKIFILHQYITHTYYIGHIYHLSFTYIFMYK